MSKVNFVSEFNLFMRYARDSSLSLRERMLWIALFYIANDRATFNEQTQEYDWPDGFIQVSNGELNLYCCLDKRAIETLRNGLKQRGLIDFQPGQKNKKNPAYKINYLSVNVGYKKVPNDVHNNAPSNAPDPVPDCAGNDGVLGAKMHPTMPPRPKDKYTNNPQSGYGGGINPSSGQRYTPGRNGGGKQPAAGDFGFVDLNESGGGCEGFVPLPWEEGGR